MTTCLSPASWRLPAISRRFASTRACTRNGDHRGSRPARTNQTGDDTHLFSPLDVLFAASGLPLAHAVANPGSLQDHTGNQVSGRVGRRCLRERTHPGSLVFSTLGIASSTSAALAFSKSCKTAQATKELSVGIRNIEEAANGRRLTSCSSVPEAKACLTSCACDLSLPPSRSNSASTYNV